MRRLKLIATSQPQPGLSISKLIHSIIKARFSRDARLEKNDLVDYLFDRCEDLTEKTFDILLY